VQPLRMDCAGAASRRERVCGRRIATGKNAQTSVRGETPMPKYQMLFDTVRAEQKFNVDIDEQETLDATLDEILFELRERGDYLKGEGQPQVVWNGYSLDFSIPLSEQGVQANDILRVSTIVLNG
jgi:hypothetical protein